MDPLYGKDGAYGDPLLCAVPHAHAMGSYGCDSPPALVDAAMSSASEVARQSQPAFVLISGDFVRHDTAGMQPTQEAFVLGVIDSTAERAADAFGPMPTSIAPVLGNNDVVPANHLDITSETPFTSVDSIVPHPYLTLIARIWRRHGLLLTAEEEASFSHGGYYARLVAPRLRLLCLNTVVYSKSLWPTPEVMDPFGQLTWMRAQLAEAKEAGDRVFLAGHNPPTLQSYNPGAPCWSDGFISSYADAIEGFEVTVAAHLYGHTHSGELRAMTTISAPRGAPLMSQNSIVPTGKGAVDPSNPAFSRWLFNPGTLEIVDSIVYASDLPFAGGANVFELTITSLAELLGLRSLDNAQVEAMGSRLAESEGLWQSYWNLWYKGGVRQRGCNGGCRLQQSCLVLHPLDAAAYERCAFAPARDGKSTY